MNNKQERNAEKRSEYIGVNEHHTQKWKMHTFLFMVVHRSDTAPDEPMAAAKTINTDVMISIGVSEPTGKGYIKFYLLVSWAGKIFHFPTEHISPHK